MKSGLMVFVAATLSVAAFAADIVLKDGRLLKDATVLSQSPRKVTIKHAAGLVGVAKKQLPADLQTQFPINEAAALAADEKAAVERQVAEAARKVETERLALARARRDTSLAANNTAAEKEAARIQTETDAVKADAKNRAEAYFVSDKYSKNPATSKNCTVTIADVRPMEGWSGRWFVKGQAAIKHYDDYRNRLAGIPLDRSTVGVTIDTAPDTHWEPDYTLEVVEFEFRYSTDRSSDPAIDIRKRDEMRVKGGRLRRPAVATTPDVTSVPAK